MIKMNSTQASRQAQHRCVECNAQDERTMSGKTRCAVCAARLSERVKERYKLRLQDGLCPDCGEPLDRPGHKLCTNCAERHHVYYLRFKEKKLAMQ